MNKKEVLELLEKHNKTWNDFEDFMSGQTVGLNPDGSIDYYEWDVERFCE